MARVGIDISQALGVSMPDIRAVAKTCGVDHALALELWETEIHEARILATLVADPDALTEPQRERWVLDITSWDLCDSAAELFGRAPAHSDAIEGWARRPEPFVKRCAFSMIARRAVWAKDAPDREFLGYLPLIRRAASKLPARVRHEHGAMSCRAQPHDGEQHLVLPAAPGGGRVDVDGEHARHAGRSARARRSSSSSFTYLSST